MRGRFPENGDGSRSVGNVHRLNRTTRGALAIACTSPAIKRSRFLRDCRSCSWWFTAVAIGSRDNAVKSARYYFQWEHAIPFVAFMILPYMSIDLFFVAAPFICRTDEELRVFSRRVIAAILIAGLCFLLFPLRFSFPRPHASGWLGGIFDWFRGMDSPFNLLPSLHAALLLLLVDLYARK